ncbi:MULTISPECIES: hypothetical protein [unclassified Polaromonas]|jgi:hypothetical protein|uniref:hypothetical protein n=1 Tax=unclassified Polaromonas TaxID=2638319 RepID=UPI00298118A7|nr:hypothetical protein [Polaromonas sp. SM01]MDW5441355.1 hypothetical protein [Polaromonas sp. SM01]
MNTLIARLARLLPFSKALAPAQDFAQKLMESAGDRAGRNPEQAQELRRAAFAYLSVVR